jgi:hypothetical protein
VAGAEEFQTGVGLGSSGGRGGVRKWRSTRPRWGRRAEAQRKHKGWPCSHGGRASREADRGGDGARATIQGFELLHVTAQSQRVSPRNCPLPIPKLDNMSERGAFRGGRGGARGNDRGGRGGGGRGGAQSGGAAGQTERPKKENILDLSKYMDKQINVKFSGGREGKHHVEVGEEELEHEAQVMVVSLTQPCLFRSSV